MARDEILALDLSTSTMYVVWARVNEAAVLTHECNAVSHTVQQSNRVVSAHSTYFVQEVEDVRTRMSGAYNKLRTVVVNMGPGSFTGLRMALSFAKGIQAARNCRLVGVSAVEHYVSIVPVVSAPLLVLLYAQRNRYFCQLYVHSEKAYVVDGATPEIRDCNFDEVVRIIESVRARVPALQVCGNGAEVFFEQLETHRIDIVPTLTKLPTHEVDLGLALLKCGYAHDIKNRNILSEDAVPLFVRSYI